VYIQANRDNFNVKGEILCFFGLKSNTADALFELPEPPEPAWSPWEVLPARFCAG
jgi:hypothetical protein